VSNTGYDIGYYDSYAEFQRDLDDRDDTYDPEFREPDGYCVHGQYVGGCGADLMCSWCEDGYSLAEAKAIVAAEAARKVRERTQRRLKCRLALASHGVMLNDVLTAEQIKRSF
jgi:hypothetical protein